MKKLILSTVLFASISFSAQEIEKNNIIKSNVAGYSLRNYNLTYERVLSKKFSISTGFGIIGNGKIPFASKLGLADFDLSGAEIKGTNFTIEPRIYLGKGYGHGFYLAPYFRYSSFEVNDLIYNLKVESNGFATTVPVSFSGKINGSSGGLMVGSQWFFGVNNNWVIDAWFAGAHYGKGSGDVVGRTYVTLTPKMQQDLQNELDQLDIPVISFDAKVNANGADAVLNGPWAGFRVGLSLGYRF